MDAGEPFLDGLAREIAEESGLSVEVIKPIHVDEWWPEIRGVKNQIVGVFFLCRPVSTNVKLSEEHDDFQWISQNDIDKFPLMDAEKDAIHAVFASS